MIGHEAKPKDLDGVSGVSGAEQLEKGGLVGVLVKDDRAAVASIENMVGMASQLSTRNPRPGAYGTEKESQDAMEK